jgi:hypothetical protein
MISDDLRKLLEDDDGLLDTPAKASAQTPDDRLIGSFLEIVEFYKEHNHEPSSLTDDITERRLASRLEGMREDPEKVDKLKSYDEYGLLRPVEKPRSLDEVLADDDLGIFDEDTDILTLKNVPQEINKPEYVGRQRKCEDFERFEPLFRRMHVDLRDGKRKIVEFKHQKEIIEGNFFVLRGVLVYVDKVGEKYISANGLEDSRLRLIYENGTESDILLLSFAKALFIDGKLVTQHDDHLLDNFRGIDKDDVASGYIYVLSSQNENPAIKHTRNLYKIGFTTGTVDDRIRGAVTDPTYLMSSVKIVATYKTYNMNTQKFEHLLHRVFSKVRLDLKVRGLDDENYIPDEWFTVPLDVIDQAITLIINGEIVNYEYDENNEQLLLRGQA